MDDPTYTKEGLEHDLYRVVKDSETRDLVVSALMVAQSNAGGVLSQDTAYGALQGLVHSGMLDTYTPKYVLAALYE